MKFIILAAVALVAVASALPVDKDAEITVVSSTNEQQPDGGFVYAFETSDGTKREETGVVKEVLDEENKLQKVVVVRGSFSYRNANGQEEYINYTADEAGFHPEGPSIPQAVQPARR